MKYVIKFLCIGLVIYVLYNQRVLPTFGYSFNFNGMHFILIPSGEFAMGSPEDSLMHEPNEAQVKVKITRPFWMQTTEVTQRQWYAITGKIPSHTTKCPDCPVENISFHEILGWIDLLNKKEACSLSQKEIWELYKSGDDREASGCYRLPTEAEWEYSCRAGTTTDYSFGNNSKDLHLYAIYEGNTFDHPDDVGKRLPNPWGLYDMHGNIREYVHDKALSTPGRKPNGKKTNILLPYPDKQPTDPTGPDQGEHYVVRGGHFTSRPEKLRCAARHLEPRLDRNRNAARRHAVGFRVVRNP